MSNISDLKLDENGFVFDPITGESYTVNQAGLAVLRALITGEDDFSAVAGLARLYGKAKARMERDVAEFHSCLRAYHLV